VPPNPSDHALALKLPDDAPGHLVTRPDQTRQVPSGQHLPVAEEEILVLDQHTDDSSSGLLVNEPINPVAEALEVRRHAIDDIECQTGVVEDKGAHLAARPDRDLDWRDGHEIDTGTTPGDAREAEEHAMRDDPKHQLPAIRRCPPKCGMAMQHQRQRDRIALSESDFARIERPFTRRALQAPMSFVARPWQGIGDLVQEGYDPLGPNVAEALVVGLAPYHRVGPQVEALVAGRRRHLGHA
jgi:hypothetical protein